MSPIQRCRKIPLFSPATRDWDLALWIDYSDFDAIHYEYAGEIVRSSRHQGIPLCNTAQELAQTQARNVLVIGHGGDFNRYVFKELWTLGKKLKGRVLIACVCGPSVEVRKDAVQLYRFLKQMHQLRKRLKCKYLIHFDYPIYIQEVWDFFQQLTRLASAQPGLSAAQAFEMIYLGA